MAITVSVRPQTNIVTALKQNKATVSSVNVGLNPNLTLGQIKNVDASNPDDGEALIFDASRNEYVVKPISINSNNITNITGGTF